MKLAKLVETSRRVTESGGRLEKIALLAGLLAEAGPDEIEIATTFLTGSLRQSKVNLGWAALRAAMPESGSESSTLDLAEVDAAFERISRVAGKGSAGERLRMLRELLTRATTEEQRFLAGLVMGEVRQGALEGVVVEAVARAARLPPTQVRRAFMMTGNLPAVAKVALQEGNEGLSRLATRLFQPVLPMLADSAADEGDALAELGEAALEYKLDGARIQVHKSGDRVVVYSRRLNDVSAAVPEVVESIGRLPARELILDGEVLALRPGGTPHPFQVTMRRFGRRLDVERLRGELPVTPFLFDLLYLDGSLLLDEPLSRRLAALAELAPGLLVPRLVTASPEDARRFLQSALDAGHEGIMAKALDAPYEAGRRGRRWLKVKPARTLDLVVLAAEWGNGRRKGWLSNLHLGARDPTLGFVMLGKTFKGMTDEMLAWQTTRLQELEVASDGYTVHVRPELVVEVAFNDLQASPQYPGGLALRFARVKRYRTDKTAAEADTLETLREIYRRQTGLDATL